MDCPPDRVCQPPRQCYLGPGCLLLLIDPNDHGVKYSHEVDMLPPCADGATCPHYKLAVNYVLNDDGVLPVTATDDEIRAHARREVRDAFKHLTHHAHKPIRSVEQFKRLSVAGGSTIGRRRGDQSPVASFVAVTRNLTDEFVTELVKQLERPIPKLKLDNHVRISPPSTAGSSPISRTSSVTSSPVKSSSISPRNLPTITPEASRADSPKEESPKGPMVFMRRFMQPQSPNGERVSRDIEGLNAKSQAIAIKMQALENDLDERMERLENRMTAMELHAVEMNTTLHTLVDLLKAHLPAKPTQ